MTLISKRNLAVLEAVPTTNTTGYDFTCVKIEDGKIWAGDGHHLYFSALSGNPDDYPDMGVSGIEHKECMLIPAAALRKAERDIPKSKNLPILNNIQVLIDDEYKHLVTTDLDITNDVKVKHQKDPTWPNTDQIVALFPKEPKVEVVLSVAELETLVKVVKKHGAESVTFKINSPSDMVGVSSDDGDLQGYIMPYYK